MAFSTIELIPEAEAAAHEGDEDIARLYANPDYPTQADGIVDGAYRTTQPEDWDGFRAGSCSSYGWWRELLCKLAYDGTPEETVWTDRVTSGLFYELLYFADNEGVIGPKTSAKLAADFAEFAPRYEAYAKTVEDEDERDGLIELYGLWRRAFEIAAGHGAVQFC